MTDRVVVVQFVDAVGEIRVAFSWSGRGPSDRHLAICIHGPRITAWDRVWTAALFRPHYR